MAVVNSYNYSKPKNYVNVNIGGGNQSQSPMQTASQRSRESEKTDQYLEQRVMSAKPEELTYMLYEGMVRFLKKAIMALDAKDYEKVHNNAVKTQKIIEELRSTLNMEIPISENLDSLYEYLDFKVFEANVDKSRELFEEALSIAEEFKETWKAAFHLS